MFEVVLLSILALEKILREGNSNLKDFFLLQIHLGLYTLFEKELSCCLVFQLSACT